MDEHDKIPMWEPLEIEQQRRDAYVATLSLEDRLRYEDAERKIAEAQRRDRAYRASIGALDAWPNITRRMTMDEYQECLKDPQAWDAEVRRRFDAAMPADVRKRIEQRKQMLASMQNPRWN